MFALFLLAPGERVTVSCLAGFLTSPEKQPSRPAATGQWQRGGWLFPFSLKGGITVAGTVPELHRIPFYIAGRSVGGITKRQAKIENISG